MSTDFPGGDVGAAAAAGPDAAQRRVFGDFVVEREVGRGGMGVVVLATQQSMGRKVALKILPSFAGMDPSAVARFRREAGAAGRLSHPGIVPVHSMGVHDGTHYFVMDYVDGPALGSLIDQLGSRRVEKLTASMVEELQIAERYPALRESARGQANAYVRSCARLAMDVANALRAAHRQRIVHRDLKPSNILIHPAGRPVLVDFGLARDEESLSVTKTGEQVGTPAYMAPEQATGRKKMDARVDVWGLGAVLYEMLTLSQPFVGSTSAEIMLEILESDPVPVRKRNPNVPIDLEIIVHRCLAKDPDDRYPAIEALEHDLRAFLTGEAILSRAPGRWTRCKAFLQRRRQRIMVGIGASVAACAIALLAGVIGEQAGLERGKAALDGARTALVEAVNADRARDLYEQALALTRNPAEVRRRRLQDFRDAVERHYGSGTEELRRFSGVFDEAERAEVSAPLERLEGRGTIVFATRTLEQATRSLETRELLVGGLADWQGYQAGHPLREGEYLVRATGSGGASAAMRVRILRDQKVEIVPRWFSRLEVPDDTAAAYDPRNDTWTAVDRFEVSRVRYRDWLASLADDQRAAMLPVGWDGGAADDDRPVRGLSYHQARAFALIHGAHLPSMRELWLAASGGLEGLTYPWGNRFDPGRLVADPFTLVEPEAVNSRAEGQSPLGVHHVLGNVAEILSPVGDATLFTAGGHFQVDDPRALRLQGSQLPTSALRDSHHQDPLAGVRLARFLPPADTPEERTRAEARRDQLRLGATASVLHDWSVTDHGAVEYRLELNGIHDGRTAECTIPIVTPGFLHGEACGVADGHGSPLAARWSMDASGEGGRIVTPFPSGVRAGQGYRLVVSMELLPASGLHPERDTYVARIPLKRGGRVASLHSLTLPPGSALLDAMPLPVRYHRDGRLVLEWQPTQDSQIETAVVRFRKDGILASRWLRHDAAQRQVDRLLEEWHGDGAGLGELLDPVFLALPMGTTRSDALGSIGHRPRLDRIAIDDITQVGPMLSVDLTADWTLRDRDGVSFVLRAWPLLLQFRGEQRPTLVRMMPRAAADTGRYGAAEYLHNRLRARIGDIAGTMLTRTQDELAELQVRLIPPGLPDIGAQVVGHFAEADAEPAAVLFRLTSGASVLRPGQRLRVTTGEDGWQELDWLFGEAKGQAVARERWRMMTRGRRHFLVRFTVVSPDAEAAQMRFASKEAQAWFADVIRAVKVE